MLLQYQSNAKGIERRLRSKMKPASRAKDTNIVSIITSSHCCEVNDNSFIYSFWIYSFHISLKLSEPQHSEVWS